MPPAVRVDVVTPGTGTSHGITQVPEAPDQKKPVGDGSFVEDRSPVLGLEQELTSVREELSKYMAEDVQYMKTKPIGTYTSRPYSEECKREAEKTRLYQRERALMLEIKNMLAAPGHY